MSKQLSDDDIARLADAIVLRLPRSAPAYQPVWIDPRYVSPWPSYNPYRVTCSTALAGDGTLFNV